MGCPGHPAELQPAELQLGLDVLQEHHEPCLWEKALLSVSLGPGHVQGSAHKRELNTQLLPGLSPHCRFH